MQKTILITFIFFAVIFLGCKKNKFSSVPQLKYVSVSQKVLEKNQTATIKLSYTDAEGDLDSLFIKRIGLHCQPFTDNIKFPAIPASKDQKGDVYLTIMNGLDFNGTSIDFSANCGITDTMTIQFYAKDRAANKSDSILSDIIILKN